MITRRTVRPRRSIGPFGLPEWIWLLAASALILLGLAAVYGSKQPILDAGVSGIATGNILNVNAVRSGNEFLPFLPGFPSIEERQFVAKRLFEYVGNNRPLSNVGALAKIRVGRADLEAEPRAVTLRADLGERRTIGLISLRTVKSSWVIRSPAEFRNRLLFWAFVYFAAFHLVGLIWQWQQFEGEYSLLTAVHLLTGVALITMISLRDPIRDTLSLADFAGGAVIGCVLLVLPCIGFLDYRRLQGYRYTPLYVSLALFILLAVFGRGPEGSDAKVSLFHFQPVEIIKILLVFFMAGYLKDRWEHLRDLSEESAFFAWLPSWIRVPRLQHFLPMTAGVVVSLLFFYILRDLGPAMIISVVFLTMYGVARARSGLVIVGFVTMAAGLAAGHFFPPLSSTVNNRVNMWLSAWDNTVRGGDQVAHALWAFATGGFWGSGIGWGDPEMIPRGDDDLILAAIGEEWGYIGILTITLVFGFIVVRGFRIARNAASEYGFFLAFGLSTLLAVELMVITSGIAQVLPLTGVVSPFLSLGKSSMICNFLIVAVLISLSQRRGNGAASEPFRIPLRVAAIALGLFGAVLAGRIGYVQVVANNRITQRVAQTIHADQSKGPEYNPRILAVANLIPRGDIFDRNGVLLATSSWTKLDSERAKYRELGINIDIACARSEIRHYPFGAETVHLIGDIRTNANFGNRSVSLVERDSKRRLKGFSDDFSELVPAAHRRRQPNQPALEVLLARPRDVHVSIDIRLQLEAARILDNHLRLAGNQKAAVIVMDSATGDILAAVNRPVPRMPAVMPPLDSPVESFDPFVDRARNALYPPGSSFKLVTAIAALRKDSSLIRQGFQCLRLSDGRAGVRIWNHDVRDDINDMPHGIPNMREAIRDSCNAYFAQLGVQIGARAIEETADLLEITTDNPKTPLTLRDLLPQAAYGQGEVTATPFKMARVAATIAAGGSMPQGRWIIDESNPRNDPPKAILSRDSALEIASAMRAVVVSGTASQTVGGGTDIAGKTGTAQTGKDETPHAWFVGYAPWSGQSTRTIAFAVIVEHGGYGGAVAAPIARDLVTAAHRLGIL